MTRIQGPLYGGGLVAQPIRVGPIVPANRVPTYLQPVLTARQLFTNPPALTTTGFLTAKTGASLPAAAGTVTFVPDGSLGITAMAFSRNVVVTVTHASSIVACNGVITGLDEYGNTITEAWAITATGTTKTFTGAVAFLLVSSITFVCVANAQANTIIAGNGLTFGLQFTNPIATSLREVSAGSVVTNGVFVAGSSAANADRRGTYTPNTAPNGATTYDVYYFVVDPAANVAL